MYYSIQMVAPSTLINHFSNASSSSNDNKHDNYNIIQLCFNRIRFFNYGPAYDQVGFFCKKIRRDSFNAIWYYCWVTPTSWETNDRLRWPESMTLTNDTRVDIHNKKKKETLRYISSNFFVMISFYESNC